MHDTQDHQHIVRTKENFYQSSHTWKNLPQWKRRGHVPIRAKSLPQLQKKRGTCLLGSDLARAMYSAFPQTTGGPPPPPKPPDTPCSGGSGKVLGGSILCAVWRRPRQLHHGHQYSFGRKTLVLCQWPHERLQREEVRRPRLPKVDRLRLRWRRPNQGRGRPCWSWLWRHLHGEQPHSPTRTPISPETLLERKLHDDGQIRRKNGHFWNAWTVRWDDGSDATEALGRSESRSAPVRWWAAHWEWNLQQIRSRTATGHSRSLTRQKRMLLTKLLFHTDRCLVLPPTAWCPWLVVFGVFRKWASNMHSACQLGAS